MGADPLHPLIWPLTEAGDWIPDPGEAMSGDADQVAALVLQFEQIAATTGEQAGFLKRATPNPDVWDSDAVAGFEALKDRVVTGLEAVSERFTATADALGAYVPELGEALGAARYQAGQAAEALWQLQQVQGQVQQIETEHLDGMAIEDWEMAYGPVDPDIGYPRAAYEGAKEALAQARRGFADAFERRYTAAETAQDAITSAIEHDPLTLQELLATDPDAIAELDDVPVEDLDTANRLFLASERQRLEERLAELRDADGDHDDEISWIESQLDGIEVIEERLDSAPGGREAYLLGFSTDGNGQAVVAIGDPTTADNVVTYVPGTGTRLKGKLADDIDRVDAMAYDAARLDPDADTAVIMWLGYDAPQDLVRDAPYASFASDGAGPLRDFQAWLEANHTRGDANYTVLGHSYGSTVIGHAADGHDLQADNLVFVGSPGVGVDHVSDLGIDPDHVFATAAFHDPVGLTPSEVHNIPPHRDDFGAIEFRSDPGPISPDAHSNYWDRDNQSRSNMAAIITNQYDLVREGRETPGWYDVVDVPRHVDDAGEWIDDRIADTPGWVADRADDVVEVGSDAADAAGDYLSDRWDDFRDGISNPFG